MQPNETHPDCRPRRAGPATRDTKLTIILALAGLVAGSVAAQEMPMPSMDAITLWYDKPGANWGEALPVGNGRLGAMVFGGTAEDRLQLNEHTPWGGGPNDYTHPEAGKILASLSIPRPTKATS